MRIAARFLLLTLLAPAACSLAQTLTITHATVIDTVTGHLQPNMTVTVQGNRITGVMSGARTAPGAQATGTQATGTRVDAHGAYLIPGLWDMHTHVFFGHTAVDGRALILPLFLANGVTGVRDMGSNLDEVLAARAAIAAHQLLGPRMVVSGPMLDGPKTTYTAAIPIGTPAQGRAAVDMLKQRGVDFIKVQSGVPRDAYFAIADETRKDHIVFEGHVPDAIRASEAVAQGQRTFEHLIGVFEASSPDEDKYLTGKKTPGMFLATYDPAREARLIALVAEHQVWQCPTLYWERGQWLVDAVDYTKDPDLAYAGHSWVTTQWPAAQKAILKSLDSDPLAVRQQFVVHELGIVRRMHAAGIPFLAGTDTPAGVDVIPGISLHLELQRFVAAGFTPLQALQTATLNPALFYNKLKDYGTVQTGKMADLVLLRANPLVNIANTRSIVAVVADGQYFSPQRLASLRQQLKAEAAKR
jgi:imidazolonepropionase-like amidohydrolase